MASDAPLGPLDPAPSPGDEREPSFANPGVVGMWLFLAAGRLLVSRLPLVPNKDLLFANFAIILIGQGEALSELVAFTAALTLFAHVLFKANVARKEATMKSAAQKLVLLLQSSRAGGKASKPAPSSDAGVTAKR